MCKLLGNLPAVSLYTFFFKKSNNPAIILHATYGRYSISFNKDQWDYLRWNKSIEEIFHMLKFTRFKPIFISHISLIKRKVTRCIETCP